MRGSIPKHGTQKTPTAFEGIRIGNRHKLIVHSSTLAFAALFATLTTLSLHIQIAPATETALGQSVHGDWNENVFSSFSPLDLVIFIGAFVFSCAMIQFMSMLAIRMNHRVISQRETLQIRPLVLFALSAVLLFLAWIPYLLTFYPGGLYADTIGVIDQAGNLALLTNQHTILYVFEWKACLSIAETLGYGKNAALFIMTVYQTVVMIGVSSYFVTWLYKQRLRLWVIAIAQLFFMFFPLYPLNAISLWKDTLFSSLMFLFAIVFLDFCLDNSKTLRLKPSIAYFSTALFVAFSRNNGIYIVLAATFILVFVIWIKKSPYTIRDSCSSYIVVYAHCSRTCLFFIRTIR